MRQCELVLIKVVEHGEDASQLFQTSSLSTHRVVAAASGNSCNNSTSSSTSSSSSSSSALAEFKGNNGNNSSHGSNSSSGSVVQVTVSAFLVHARQTPVAMNNLAHQHADLVLMRVRSGALVHCAIAELMADTWCTDCWRANATQQRGWQQGQQRSRLAVRW